MAIKASTTGKQIFNYNGVVMAGQAFRRSIMLSSAIAAIMGTTQVPGGRNISTQQKEAIASLGVYRSRGKGGGCSGAGARHGKHMDAKRLAVKNRNIAKRK
jgi:hypothetical protein